MVLHTRPYRACYIFGKIFEIPKNTLANIFLKKSMSCIFFNIKTNVLNFFYVLKGKIWRNICKKKFEESNGFVCMFFLSNFYNKIADIVFK